jgi:hypothetical protein
MEKDLGRIKKNDTTDIVIRLDDFGGRKGLTIREFVTSDRYSGFTKAGTRIPAESVKKFQEMIGAIRDEDLKQDELIEPKKSIPKEQKTLKDSVKKQESSDDEDLDDDLPDY